MVPNELVGSGPSPFYRAQLPKGQRKTRPQADRELRSRSGGDRWLPYAVHVLGLRIAWPWRHRYTNEFQVLIGYVSILEGRANGDVDRCAGRELCDRAVHAIVSPYLAAPFEYKPELTDGGVDRRPVGLAWGDGAVDHVASRTIHQEADVSACG